MYISSTTKVNNVGRCHLGTILFALPGSHHRKVTDHLQDYYDYDDYDFRNDALVIFVSIMILKVHVTFLVFSVLPAPDSPLT